MGDAFIMLFSGIHLMGTELTRSKRIFLWLMSTSRIKRFS